MTPQEFNQKRKNIFADKQEKKELKKLKRCAHLYQWLEKELEKYPENGEKICYPYPDTLDHEEFIWSRSFAHKLAKKYNINVDELEKNDITRVRFHINLDLAYSSYGAIKKEYSPSIEEVEIYLDNQAVKKPKDLPKAEDVEPGGYPFRTIRYKEEESEPDINKDFPVILLAGAIIAHVATMAFMLYPLIKLWDIFIN